MTSHTPHAGGPEPHALLAIVLAAWMAAPIASFAAAPAPPGAVVSPAAAAPVSVAKTDALMNAFKARNYTAAFALLDDRMKAALPPEKLKATWESLVASLGPIVSWSFEPPTDNQGMEQRVGALRFQRGEAKAMIVVNPKTGLIAGFGVRRPSSSATGQSSRVDTTAAPVAVTKADALMSALKAGNYTAAFALFDDHMKAAVPLDQLRTTWEGIVIMLGPLVSWTFESPTTVQGMEQRPGSLRFEHGEAKAMVVVDPKTSLVSGFFIRPPSPPAAGHASYVDTTAFHSVDLKVGTDPYLLGATLTVPSGAGPFPAVVLVHGSGPQDRDETLGGNRVFRDLAEGLSSKGIAVLRYDKRSKIYAAKIGPNATIDDEVILDALAAVRQLAARPEVDPKRIFVIGHSLGAQLAPEIAVRAGQVAGVVLLAPPGRPPWDVVLAQMRFLGAPPDQIADIERKGALFRQGKGADETLLGASGTYWLDWGKRDGIGMAKKLGKPILVLRGDRDFQVADEDLAAWRVGLDGQKGATVQTVPNLNHLFIRGEGKPSPAEYETPGHVDPSVIEMVRRFIAASAPGPAR